MKLEYLNKATGEIIDLRAKFNKETDRATLTSTNLNLNMIEVEILRSTTNLLTGLQVTVGIATGIVLGKGIFTGICIAIGTAVIADMVTPTDFVYRKILKIKDNEKHE